MLPAIANCSALEGIAVNGTPRSVLGLPFCNFLASASQHSSLQFTNLEIGLTGSEEVGEKVVKSDGGHHKVTLFSKKSYADGSYSVCLNGRL